MKKITIAVIMFFLGLFYAKALTYGGCEYSQISRLKSIVNNINISYDYHETNEEIYFDVTINNLTNDIYLYDSGLNTYYYFSDTNNGELVIRNYSINSGTYKFYSNLSDCNGLSIGSKYYKFPVYNQYFNDPICDDIKGYGLCQKWIDNSYTYDRFKSLVLQYKSSLNKKDETKNEIEYETGFIDLLTKIYTKYYYIFLIAIIAICGLIMYISNKRNSFKL